VPFPTSPQNRQFGKESESSRGHFRSPWMIRQVVSQEPVQICCREKCVCSVWMMVEVWSIFSDDKNGGIKPRFYFVELVAFVESVKPQCGPLDTSR
jgi:hypothetical protein